MQPTVCFTSAALGHDVSLIIVKELLNQCARQIGPTCTEVELADIHVHIGTPHIMPPQRSRTASTKFVFYTAAEAMHIPQEWVDVLNQCTEIWTPSQFSRDAFVASGVCRTIRVVPHGIACPTTATTRRHSDGSEPFTFMWQGAKLKTYRNGHPFDGDRKRGLLVERAFNIAKLPNSRLILKYLPIEGSSYDFRAGPVWYICKSMTNEEIDELDALTDAFVWPTMGEGFGMPPLEKLAKGIPAFATYWSGPLEYQRDFALPRLLPTRMQTVRFNGVETQMADVDEQDVVELMRYCYENRQTLSNMRSDLIETARRWDVQNVLKPSLTDAIRQLWAQS